MKHFSADRPFIEHKYHHPDQPFDPYRRMAYHGYDFDARTGLSDDEILAGLERLAVETEGLPHPIAKARAIKYVLDNTRIDVNEHDIFVGFWSVNRLFKHTTQKKWWATLCRNALCETDALMKDMVASGAVDIWPDFDHVIPDWDAILRLGFAGLRTRAAAYHAMHRAQGTLTPEMDAHFVGIDIEYSAILAIIDRLYRLAEQQTHPRAEQYAACLRQLRDGAPTNLYEAMQTMYIYFIVSECFDHYQVRSLGNGLDHSLYRFYADDLASGRATRRELREQLAYFLMQWSAIGNYWGQPFYLGGTNPDGSTKYNDLSRDILDVYAELGIYNPKIQLKVNENTPDDILHRAFRQIRDGNGSFTFCCEPGYIRAVMRYGASYEEALDMDISGCYETRIRGNEVSSVTGYVNAAKAVDYVLHNGYEARIGRQFGPLTGELDTLHSFADFLRAVQAQWEFLIKITIKCANAYERYFSVINPSSIYSATIEGSLQKGVDAYGCGVKFNNSCVLNCAFASLVDAVMAVKALVYDSGTVTLAELKQALDCNWVGYEALRTRALKLKHKYGNGDAETDAMARELAAFFADRVNNRPNARGGVYKANLHSAMQFIRQGEHTPATADGRRAGEELSKNASPSVGMDRQGVTALINSALRLKPSTYSEGFCLDVMLHPSAVSGDEGLDVMKALLMTYLRGEGMTIQFNVFGADTLRDAQRNPDKYRNLQVRVCGWNVLWNNLSEKEQNAYIARAEGIAP